MPNENPERVRHIMAVSDATGRTCELVVRAALAQFRETQVHLERIPDVRTEAQLVEIFERAAEVNGIVIFTMVYPRLRRMVLDLSRSYGVPAVDVLGPVMLRLTDLLEISPMAQPGLMHHLEETYYNRINAVDFTIKHDDGLGDTDYEHAEIILVGVSRASKTPTSVYLAYRGWKVANVPIVLDLPLPEALLQVDQRKIIGLTVQRQVLADIRRNRQQSLVGDGELPDYTDMDEIQKELRYALQLFHRHGWPVLDVTHKSIEETATEVMRIITSRTGRRDSFPPPPEREEIKAQKLMDSATSMGLMDLAAAAGIDASPGEPELPHPPDPRDSRVGSTGSDDDDEQAG